MANEVKKYSTALSNWTNTFTGLVQRDFAECGVTYDDYAKECGMNAMVGIYNLIKDGGNDPQSVDPDSIRSAVGQCASLKLNASAYPSECYFQIRKKKVGSNWVQQVEMNLQGAGNDALLRQFGAGVEEVYPVWIVRQGDDFVYPRYVGIETTAPEWMPKGKSDKIDKIVYPVMVRGKVQYLIAERESARVNLFAHVRNNLMNETFGIAESRYKATPAQKKEINERKQLIYDALNRCETVDEMLACPEARPYISAAWLESTESMIERKLRNNAIRKFPKDYDAMAKRSFIQTDDVYRATQEEIEANANQIDFEVDADFEEVIE